ncbi:hypothetical protein AAFC00_006346 [Neodothiora populina]|uniref:Uncharacterized protein n=1 Tax=Neodothiora populina TaxID=2781224 RepID=A0ABR3P5N4_9PEZI
MPGVPPDAFDQVKKALRGMFRRKKKPLTENIQPVNKTTAAAAPSPSQPAPPPSAPSQKSSPIHEHTSKRPHTSHTSQTSNKILSDSEPLPELLPELRPESASGPIAINVQTYGEPGNSHRRPPTPSSYNAPRELSSSPRSPHLMSPQYLATPPPSDLSVSSATEIENHESESHESDAEAPSEKTADKASETLQVPTTVAAQSLTTAEAAVPPSLGSNAEEEEAVKRVSANAKDGAIPHEEDVHQSGLADSREPQSVEEPSSDGPAEQEEPEQQEQSDHLPTSSRDLPAADSQPKDETDTADIDAQAASLAQHEEPHHANEAARRAPAVFHDEKIPVMAEPPQVRQISIAPGMVATSGPLEDFPFR